MAVKYDFERLVTDLQTFLQANLNAQISALNTEKNDSTVLNAVAAGSWHLQYLGDKADVGDPIILLEEAAEPKFQGSGDRLAVTYGIVVWTIVNDNGTDPKVPIRLWRYRRALLDLIQPNWDLIGNGSKVQIAATVPTPNFKFMEIDFPARAIGVELRATWAD